MSYQTETSSATESCSNGAYHSLGSLVKPAIVQRSKRACCSQPFIKPDLKDQILTKIFKHPPFKILSLKETNSQFLQNEPQKHEQTDFSIEDSRCFLRYLAAELDRIVQLKDVTIVSGVSDGEINEEEGCTLILQWVEELRSTQQTSQQQPMKVPGKLKVGADRQASQRSDMQQKCADDQHRLNDGKRILSDWIMEFKRRTQDFNRLLFTAEQKAVIKELVKQRKKSQFNMLPVMDFIIRNIMLEDKSEESLLKLWFKTEQRFKKAGDMHVPAPVWKWIKKSSDQVILDQSTANPTLVVYQDGRSVRTKTHEESEPWLSHQQTRNQYGLPCVQAKKGYITGRHYWEVDVTGKCDWRLGVVQESAPRRGFINMNTTAGYWTLRLQLGSLMALTDPVTKLNQATPSKIGVYLDIEEGQLSFYNTEKRKNIFTFKTDFSKCGRIYPVFGTVETNRSLKII